MLTFTDVTLRRGGRPLIEGASFTIHRGQRVGLVGRNGSGKSSLFAAITGELASDRGEIAMPRGLVIASVAQHTPALPRPAVEHVLDGDEELRAIEAALVAAEAAHDADAIATLHERLRTIDGYTAHARAARLLDGLGFAPDSIARPVADFSGGWRMRLNLARALMRRADLLLLDEPTNHLDYDAVLWLKEHLARFPGTLIEISHDREFLDATCTHTLHLAEGRATLYAGNYSRFEALRAERLAQQAATRSQQEKRIAHLRSFVERFGAKASKAKQAQARVKMIERIALTAPVRADSPFDFAFPEPARKPAPALALRDAVAGYRDAQGHETPVLVDVKLTLSAGDRIALLGPNGAGKSTLVKLLAGLLPPLGGEVTRHTDLRVGYFAQHQVDELDPNATPIELLRRLAPGLGEQAARDYLGGWQFRDDRVFEPVAPFSGGEKARLALALIAHRAPNLLLLDEPTNHLDLDLRQALELALAEYAGAVVLVAHDRHLIEASCDVLWRVADGHAQPFDGDLDDYARWLAEHRRAKAGARGGPTASAPKPKAEETPRVDPREQRRGAAAQRERERPLRQALQRAEKTLERCQDRLAQIEGLLADPAIYHGERQSELRTLQAEQSALRTEMEAAEQAWLVAAGELEGLGPRA